MVKPQSTLSGLGETTLDRQKWIFPTLVGATTAFFVARLIPEQKFSGGVVGFALGLGAGIELSRDRGDGS